MDKENIDSVVHQTTTGGEYNTTNYSTIVPMTFEERYKMYMRCKKEELAKMLAQRDEYDKLLRQPVYPYPVPQCPWPNYPCDPVNPLGPWVTYSQDSEQTTIA